MDRPISVTLVAFVSACLACAGCHAPPANPPQSLPELQAYQQRRCQDFTLQAIALHNLKRALSTSLAPEKRIESLRVVEQLGTTGAETYTSLAAALADSQTPPVVRQAILAYLIKKDYPGLGQHVSNALPHAQDPALRSAILEWLYEHPAPELLSEVVKLWASQESLDTGTEARYRGIVERLARQKWDDALLSGLNASGFAARGSAVEVLAARLPPAMLRRKLAELTPRSQAGQALKYFAERFDYVPVTGRELLACVLAHGHGDEQLNQVARIALEWQTHYHYRFNIRDFHLLARLAGDPLRKPMSRRELTEKLSRAIAYRQQTTTRPAGRAAPPVRDGRPVGFDAQAESLSMADLWNLWLINEMLNRPRALQAVQIMAKGDRADQSSQWGGLIRYEQGQAEAKLYPPEARRADDQYLASRQMLDSAPDALAFFIGHFGPAGGSRGPVGPSAREIGLARQWNLCGVILAGAEPGGLSVTYFTPEGLTIDMGNFSILP